MRKWHIKKIKLYKNTLKEIVLLNINAKLSYAYFTEKMFKLSIFQTEGGNEAISKIHYLELVIVIKHFKP